MNAKTLTPRGVLDAAHALTSGDGLPNPEYQRAIVELAALVLHGEVDDVLEQTARTIAEVGATPMHPHSHLAAPCWVRGSFTEPKRLSDRALQIGSRLTQLEGEGREESEEFRRLDAELLAEPSYRWIYRNPMQLKLGAGWETEYIGERVLLGGEPHMLIAISRDARRMWELHVPDGRVFLACPFTVLDLAPAPQAVAA
jgi:hypothetical protein